MSDKEQRLDRVEIASVCGRFARLQKQSKVKIGLSTLAEMASLRSSQKTARHYEQQIKELIEEIERYADCAEVQIKIDDWQALKAKYLGGNH